MGLDYWRGWCQTFMLEPKTIGGGGPAGVMSTGPRARASERQVRRLHLLADPAMGEVEHLGQEQQVIPAEAVRGLPLLVAVLVQAARR